MVFSPGIAKALKLNSIIEREREGEEGGETNVEMKSCIVHLNRR